MRLLTGSFAALVLALATPAHAGDSLWLRCKGAADVEGGAKLYLLANLLEHRSPRGDARDVSVTLIYGDHLARGTIRSEEADRRGALEARFIDAPRRALFTGDAVLDMQLTTLRLAGKLDRNFGAGKPDPGKATATLACEPLDDHDLSQKP